MFSLDALVQEILIACLLQYLKWDGTHIHFHLFNKWFLNTHYVLNTGGTAPSVFSSGYSREQNGPSACPWVLPFLPSAWNFLSVLCPAGRQPWRSLLATAAGSWSSMASVWQPSRSHGSETVTTLRWALPSAHLPSEWGQVRDNGGGRWRGSLPVLKCPASRSPIIRQIRQACLEPFKAFEECLRQNEAAVGNCAEHVHRFLQCAEQVQPTHRPSTLEVSWGSAVHPTVSSFWLLKSKDQGVTLSPTQSFTMHPDPRTSEHSPLSPLP